MLPKDEMRLGLTISKEISKVKVTVISLRAV